MIDPKLVEFVETDIERVALETFIKHGNQKDAAEELGVTINAISKAIVRIKKRAYKRNYSTEFGSERVLRDVSSFQEYIPM